MSRPLLCLQQALAAPEVIEHFDRTTPIPQTTWTVAYTQGTMVLTIDRSGESPLEAISVHHCPEGSEAFPQVNRYSAWSGDQAETGVMLTR